MDWLRFWEHVDADWFRFWDYSEATWAGLQFAVLVAAAVFAYFQVREAQSQRREAQQLREDQARPFVVVDYDVDPNEIAIVISNVGRTMARDVRLSFNPELASSWDDRPGITPLRETKLFAEGIPSLPPGKVIRAMFDVFPQREPDKLPDVYEVTLGYMDARRRKHYEDETILDLGVYRNLLHRTVRDLHDVHERLKELVREASKWSAASAGGGILAVTRREVWRRSAEIEWGYKAREGRLMERWFFSARLFVSRHLRL